MYIFLLLMAFVLFGLLVMIFKETKYLGITPYAILYCVLLALAALFTGIGAWFISVIS